MYNLDSTQIPPNYYRSQFIDSFRSPVHGDNTMVFLVQDDTDLLLYAKAAKHTWESVGDYPDSFTGIVKTVNGNAFASFIYVGALAAAQQAS
ncbi:hypothetical protein [Pedobacter aquatilis]|uniref:hypothetical protein n=1 Tax=Pedobacter aquatilis TaxID=351343 RepID=UPI00292E61AA|nr:hypothetical protein [Pedobacter aquatilis]